MSRPEDAVREFITGGRPVTKDRIIVHHSATLDGATFSWGAIRKHHLGLGWQDIGYHAGVELVGDHYEAMFGRPWWMDGAHTLGQNERALGICFVGNFDDAPCPDAQLAAGAAVIGTWMRLYAIPVSEIYPHSRFQNKTCPGKRFDMARLKGML